MEQWHIMTAKIKMHQYVIFIELRKFDTAYIKCLTVSFYFKIYSLIGNIKMIKGSISCNTSKMV